MSKTQVVAIPSSSILSPINFKTLQTTNGHRWLDLLTFERFFPIKFHVTQNKCYWSYGSMSRVISFFQILSSTLASSCIGENWGMGSYDIRNLIRSRGFGDDDGDDDDDDDDDDDSNPAENRHGFCCCSGVHSAHVNFLFGSLFWSHPRFQTQPNAPTNPNIKHPKELSPKSISLSSHFLWSSMEPQQTNYFVFFVGDMLVTS